MTEVYGEGSTTRAGWAAAEPGRNPGRRVTTDNADDPIYALFIEGDFEVIGPVHLSGGGASRGYFRAGRIVFDENGTIISVSLWDRVKPADPPFGPPLDDQ